MRRWLWLTVSVRERVFIRRLRIIGALEMSAAMVVRATVWRSLYPAELDDCLTMAFAEPFDLAARRCLRVRLRAVSRFEFRASLGLVPDHLFRDVSQATGIASSGRFLKRKLIDTWIRHGQCWRIRRRNTPLAATLRARRYASYT